MTDTPRTDPPAADPAVQPPVIPLHEMLGFTFEPPTGDDHSAEVRMPVAPAALGFTGNLHGGAIATLVDLACAVAAVKATGFDATTESMITSDMHLRYVGRPRTGAVLAKSEVVRVGRQLIIVECKVVDEEGHLVATADVSMMRVTLRRPLET